MKSEPEEISLFDFLETEKKEEAVKAVKAAKAGRAGKAEKAVRTEKAGRAVKAVKTEKSGKTEKTGPFLPWQEQWKEFEITIPSMEIRDHLKEGLLAEGLGKRDANKVLKDLFFKEKIFNTKKQAEAYLKTIGHTYAVKYKIGIAPSRQMISLKKRLDEKKSRLVALEDKQKKTKFASDFITCPHCRSRVNRKFVEPPVCPVCGGDMRSVTVIAAMKSLQEAIADLSRRYENEEERYNSRFTGGERWILRLVNPFTQTSES